MLFSFNFGRDRYRLAFMLYRFIKPTISMVLIVNNTKDFVKWLHKDLHIKTVQMSKPPNPPSGRHA